MQEFKKFGKRSVSGTGSVEFSDIKFDIYAPYDVLKAIIWPITANRANYLSDLRVKCEKQIQLNQCRVSGCKNNRGEKDGE